MSGRSDSDSSGRPPTTIDSLVRAIARVEPLAIVVGQVLDGTYELVERIGSGGMGVVFRARDRRLGRDVAIKALQTGGDEQLRRMFEREARATAQLHHANIVTLHDIGEHDRHPYLVLELLTGETLATRLARQGRLTVAEALPILDAVLAGLAFAHEHGVLHRDLKPTNLFVSSEGVVKILDFGIAKLAGVDPIRGHAAPAPAPGEAAAPQTEAGALLGTLGYMSPEQVRGEPADARSDLFSFGAVAYELLAGRRAFAATTHAEVAEAILSGSPPPLPPGVPAELERLVRRCLDKRPGGRFQTARELREQLRAISARRHRRPLAVAGALVGAAAVVALGVVALQADRTPRRPIASPAPRFTRATFVQDLYGFGARLAPDHRSLLFTRLQYGVPSIHLGAIGKDDSRPLGLDNARFLDVSASGELLLARYDGMFTWNDGSPGTLSRASADGSHVRDLARGISAASWAPDGEAIIAVRSLAGGFTLEYPLGTVRYSSPLRLERPVLSPHGDRIAFVEHTMHETSVPVSNQWGWQWSGAVATLDLATGRKQQLTRVFRNACCAIWAHDGSKLYFSASEVGQSFGLWEVGLDGVERSVLKSTDMLLLGDVADDGTLLVDRVVPTPQIRMHRRGEPREHDLGGYAWSQPSDLAEDGASILFQDGGTGSGPDEKLYLRRTDGSSPISIGEGMFARLSPDGQRIVAGSLASPASIRMFSITGGAAREVPAHGLLERWQPMWHPDGARIVYLGVDADHTRRLYVQNIDGTAPRAFGPQGTRLDAFAGGALSPDGSVIAARDTAGAWILVPLDGGEPRPVPGVRVDESVRQWTADGRGLYVAGARTDPRSIDRVELATGKRSHVGDVASHDASSRGGIEPLFINRAGTTWVYGFAVAKSDLYMVDLSPP